MYIFKLFRRYVNENYLHNYCVRSTAFSWHSQLYDVGIVYYNLSQLIKTKMARSEIILGAADDWFVLQKIKEGIFWFIL